MPLEQAPTTLRDQLSANLDAAESPPDPGGGAASPALTSASSQEGSEVKAGDRARDQQGRFAKDSAPGATKTPPPSSSGGEPPVAEAKPPRSAPARPTTWKKDRWGHWDKLTKGEAFTPDEALDLADYIVQRENDYSRGVSTYRQEYENARPYYETIQPYLQTLNQHGVKGSDWIKSLADAQMTLVMGTPEQKLAMLHSVAQQYGIPLGQTGQQMPAPAYRHPGLRQQPALTQSDVDARVQSAIYSYEAKQMLAQMEGNQEKYPHLTVVRDTMAQLLEAGLAEDYEGAYNAAIRHPRHAEIFDAMQEQQRKDEAERAAREKAEAAAKAKAAAASVRGTTPSALNAGGGKKDLRSRLSDNLDAVAGGRV